MQVLSRIIFYSANVNRQKEFYQKHFDLPLVEEIENEWLVLRAGAVELAFHLAGEAWRSQEKPGTGSNAKLVFEVKEDLKLLREKLISNGVAMREIKSYPGYTYDLCDGEDLEGNIFQLMKRR